MARANRNTLNKSRIEIGRQQRQELPDVPGATGTVEDDSSRAAEVKARKRRGKTEKHVSEDTPVADRRTGGQGTERGKRRPTA
jgi:hypothetical protein